MSDLKRIKELDLQKHYKFLANLSLVVTLISLIWIFILFMIPANPALSQDYYINVTGFYKVMFANDWSAHYTSVTAAGIGLCVWMGLSFILYGLTGWVHATRHKSLRKEEKLEMNVPAFIRMISYLFLLVVMIVLFVFILIPPDANLMTNGARDTEIINRLLSSNPTLEQLQNMCSQLGIKVEVTSGQTPTIGTYESALTSYDPYHNGNLTPWYGLTASGTAFKKSALDVGIVLFSIALGQYAICLVAAWMVSKKQIIEKDLSKKNIQELVAKYKANRKERQVIRKNKKELLEQENELLKNLYDLDQQLNQQKGEELSVIQKINQQELEEKIAKNNELKKQLEELNKQKVELKKESLRHSKFKSALHKAQETNMRQGKAKKQEIAVPDKELEEIFKSLDID